MPQGSNLQSDCTVHCALTVRLAVNGTDIDAARRVLGGVAPQRGDAAIEVAKQTPLYRIDGAFAAVRKAALNTDDGWGAALDVEEFVRRQQLDPSPAPLFFLLERCPWLAGRDWPEDSIRFEAG